MRELNNWIDSFCLYVRDTEVPQIYAKWTAISSISACLRKKVYFKLGRLKTYSNLYIILVSPPGTTRKSTAVSYGKNLVSEIQDVVLSAESNTRESLLNDLEAASSECILPDGSTFKYSAITILSKEFEIFLGQKKDNAKLIVLLTDLFDGEENVWKYKTKHSGSNFIPSVFVNLLAGTTPSSLSSSLSSDAIGGGLTTRIIFVYCDVREKNVAIPEEDLVLRETLVRDLRQIAQISGVYTFTEDSRLKYIDWYSSISKEKKICTDEAFAGWYERKPMFVRKLAMICKAAEGNSLAIEWKYFEMALAFLAEVEQRMSLAFRAVGRSEITADIDMVMSIIKAKHFIEEKELMALTWRDIDSKKLDLVIQTIVRGGFVKQEMRSPDGKPGIFYVWRKSE